MKSYWYITYVNSDGYSSARIRLDGLFFSPLKAEQELFKHTNSVVIILYHTRISKKAFYSPKTQNLESYEQANI